MTVAELVKRLEQMPDHDRRVVVHAGATVIDIESVNLLPLYHSDTLIVLGLSKDAGLNATA